MLPVASENEANLAALAELWFGGLGDVRSFLYLTGEIGVGGALVLGGELLRGAHGFAGEIGHVVVDPDGTECRCGSRGCLEQYAGQTALLRAAGIDGSGGGARVVELERRARAGDGRAVAALTEAGRMLGRVVSGAVNLVDPDAVVLGGIYRGLMPWLSPPADEELTGRVVSGLWSPGSGRLRASSVAGDAARGRRRWWCRTYWPTRWRTRSRKGCETGAYGVGPGAFPGAWALPGPGPFRGLGPSGAWALPGPGPFRGLGPSGAWALPACRCRPRGGRHQGGPVPSGGTGPPCVPGRPGTFAASAVTSQQAR